jgi:hypothetical protein
MSRATRALAFGFVLCAALSASSCGGGSSGVASTAPTPTAPASNVVPVVVDAGPDAATNPTVNTLYTSVTLCVPGSTTECQTIDHIEVDTGSYGLRVLSSVLTLALPVTLATDGNSLVECTQFVDGFSWGPVASADVQVGGEAASAVPVQVIGSAAFPSIPSGCTGVGSPEDTVAQFGANGILGIGVFAQDCGANCVANSANAFYYSCTAAACTQTAVLLTSEVQNPVPLFPVDNDGTILDLPAVADAAAATLSGSLIFGIDTETNNASGSQTVLTVQNEQASAQQQPGNLTIDFNGQQLINSFIDSGSNGIFFNDSNLAPCPAAANANPPVPSGFYCPPSAESFSAMLTGTNGVTTTQTFSVNNADTLLTANPTFAVFPALGGTYASATGTFDWGLPFYFGRRVATAIEAHTTAVGTGPYVAF